MKHPFRIDELIVFALCCWTYLSGVHCLKDVRIEMPYAVEKDSKVRMVCKYNLEGDPMYTLKWYKGDREFFRYTPMETPSKKFFAIREYPDLSIIEEESNGAQVTIQKVTRSLAGQYTCEITTDLPSLATDSGHSELRVAVPPNPQALPTIKSNMSKSKVKEGEWVELVCISPRSIPAANLTWTVNQMPISEFKHKFPQYKKRVVGGNDLEESTSNFSFLATEKLLVGNNNSLKVRCTASIYSLYMKIWEISLILDKPQKVIFNPESRANPYYINQEVSASNVRRSGLESSGNRVTEADDDEEYKGKSAVMRGSIHVLVVPIIVTITRQLL